MQGMRVSMALLRWTSREDANRFLARYMGHDHVPVFYDPNDVSQSVLDLSRQFSTRRLAQVWS